MNADGRPFLVVDDEGEMCWVLEQVLRRQGYACEKAFCGKEALALVARRPCRMAFLDAKLPDIDGLDLAWRIRELCPSLPIIIVSGYFYQEDMSIQEAKKTGLIASFISKPFEHPEILGAIELYAPC